VFTDRRLRFKSAITRTISQRVKILVLSNVRIEIFILDHFAKLR
jgi:hypothetical protein